MKQKWVFFSLVFLIWGCRNTVPPISSPLAVQGIRTENSPLSLTQKQFSYTGETLVGLTPTHPAQLEEWEELGFDLWGEQEGVFYGVMPDPLLEEVQFQGISIEQLSPQKGLSPLFTYDPQYMTYEQMVQKLHQLASEHAQLLSVQNLGPTWETTQGYADRVVWGVRIGTDDSKKPSILFTGATHARELVTPEICTNLVEYLLQGYGQDPKITDLIDHRTIWIVPMVNPDGHIQVEERKLSWRKNTHVSTLLEGFVPSYGSGVDLNRNFGHKWGQNGSSGSPYSETYRGTAPFSEPESQAIQQLAKEEQFKVVIDYHSFSDLVLWPWGYKATTPNEPGLLALGKEMAKLTGYVGEAGYELYITSGDSTDFHYGDMGSWAYTIEIGSWGDGFDPPYSAVEKFWKENLPAALVAIEATK